MNNLSFSDKVPAEVWQLEKCYNLPKSLDFEIETPSAHVDFSCSIDERSWGIKCIDTIVTRVTASFTVSVEKDGLTDQDIHSLINLHLFSDSGDKFVRVILVDTVLQDYWTVNSEIKATPSGAITLDSVEIDFRTKTISVS